jgi:type I restriction enzyme S subunit
MFDYPGSHWKRKMQMYAAYKLSNIEWVGQIPAHWNIKPLFAVLKEQNNKNRNNKVQNVLSLSYGNIVRRDVSTNFGLLPESFETYQIVDKGNLILRLTDLQNDKRSLRVGLVTESGIITSAYTCLKTKDELIPKFAYYLLHNYDLWKVFYNFGNGVRQTMDYRDLKHLPIIVPPLSEQRAIAAYLDRESARIDALIGKYQRLGELLEERQASFICKIVRTGLDSTAELKETGIPWLGMIPVHWESRKIKLVAKILRGKFGHRPRNDPSLYDGKYPFIQTGDVASASRYITSYKQTLNDKGYAVSAEFPSNTLVMTIAANIGDVAILKFNACFPDSIVGLLPETGIQIDYLYYVMKSLKSTLMGMAVQNTQLNLNIERIGAINIPLPPIDEQNLISQYLDGKIHEINRLREQIDNLIIKLQEVRIALISSAVIGKLKIVSD